MRRYNRREVNVSHRPFVFRALFAHGENGGIYSANDPRYNYLTATANTPVSTVGDNIGNQLPLVVGNRRGINLLTSTITMATQNVATIATSYTLSFTGTGTVTLTGTSTAGPLVGTGATDRVSLVFTPTAGTLTLTVSGSVTSAQLEAGTLTAYEANPAGSINPPSATSDAGRGIVNLLLQSENIGTTWGVSAATTSLNTAVGPANTVTADSLLDTVANSTHDLTQNVTLIDATTYTLSIYAHADTLSRFELIITRGSGATFLARGFNLGTGASYANNSGLTDAGSGNSSITALAGGWYRVSITFLSDGTGGVARVRLANAAGTVSYIGTLQSLFLTGGMLNLGSTALDYQYTSARLGGPGLNLYQTSSSARPFWGRRPNVPGGLGVRNRLANNAYTDATQGAIAAAGSELITNGLLVTDATGWTNLSTGTGTAAWAAGSLAIAGGAAGVGIIEQSFAVTAGVVYTLIFSNETNTLTGTGGVRVGTTSGGTDLLSISSPSVSGARHYTFTPAATGTVYLQFRNTANNTSNVYVVSCRQQALPLRLRVNQLSIGSRSLFTVTAVASVSGVATFSFRLQVPVTGGAGAGTYIYLEQGTYVDALTAEQWAWSVPVALTSGALTNVSQVRLAMIERTSAGSSVATKNGSDFKASLTSTLSRKEFITTLTGGGTVAKLQPAVEVTHTAGVLVDLTLQIGEAQIEKAAAVSALQHKLSENDYLEDGYPSIASTYFGGDDYFTMGTQSFGSASLNCVAGQAWSFAYVARTIAAGGVMVAQAGATLGNRTFESRNNGGGLLTNSRGTVTDNTLAAFTDGRVHSAVYVWNGTILTLSYDSGAPVTIPVGTAVQELENILIGARTESSVGNIYTGWLDFVADEDRAWTAAEQLQVSANCRNQLGSL